MWSVKRNRTRDMKVMTVVRDRAEVYGGTEQGQCGGV